jgi:hypothetical protein
METDENSIREGRRRRVVPDKVGNQSVHRITYLPVANSTIYTYVVGHGSRKAQDPAENPIIAVPPTNMGEKMRNKLCRSKVSPWHRRDLVTRR